MLWWTLQQLKSKDWKTREQAAKKLGSAKKATAVEPLVAALQDKNEGSSRVRAAAAEALGKIGDARAVEPLVAALNDRHREVQRAAVVALGKMEKVEDPRAIDIDPLLKLLFADPRGGHAEKTQKVLLAVVPFSPLTEQLVNWIVQASTYEHKYHGWSHDAGYITLKVSDNAIRRLCQVNTPVTSNVLHLIAQKKDITVTMSTGCNPDWQQTVSFQGQRDLALAELKRRGNPPYQPEAYLLHGVPRSSN